jgi:hypothetical protein
MPRSARSRTGRLLRCFALQPLAQVDSGLQVTQGSVRTAPSAGSPVPPAHSPARLPFARMPPPAPGQRHRHDRGGGRRLRSAARPSSAAWPTGLPASGPGSRQRGRSVRRALVADEATAILQACGDAIVTGMRHTNANGLVLIVLR